ncbi:hypothetical protein K439DRAFT_141182 [Ramaria rubella]|nr:hypothetical protein K439DRAFT_141182 [Ramaria rubella]
MRSLATILMVLATGPLALSAPMCVACLLTHLRPVILISSHPIARRIGVQDISTRVVMRNDDIGVKNVPLGLLAARMWSGRELEARSDQPARGKVRLVDTAEDLSNDERERNRIQAKSARKPASGPMSKLARLRIKQVQNTGGRNIDLTADSPDPNPPKSPKSKSPKSKSPNSKSPISSKVPGRLRSPTVAHVTQSKSTPGEKNTLDLTASHPPTPQAGPSGESLIGSIPKPRVPKILKSQTIPHVSPQESRGGFDLTASGRNPNPLQTPIRPQPPRIKTSISSILPTRLRSPTIPHVKQEHDSDLDLTA